MTAGEWRSFTNHQRNIATLTPAESVWQSDVVSVEVTARAGLPPRWLDRRDHPRDRRVPRYLLRNAGSLALGAGHPCDASRARRRICRNRCEGRVDRRLNGAPPGWDPADRPTMISEITLDHRSRRNHRFSASGIHGPRTFRMTGKHTITSCSVPISIILHCGNGSSASRSNRSAKLKNSLGIGQIGRHAGCTR
jgi:hypothetical protein